MADYMCQENKEEEDWRLRNHMDYIKKSKERPITVASDSSHHIRTNNINRNKEK